MKFIVITGGVISGLGKGITASSIALLLKDSGYSVTAVKIDPYLNVDAGTMSPFEHGEVFVLEDGTETDLDLGNYERFLGVKLHKQHNITGGNVFKKIIDAERRGDYLGQTVQFIPHVSNKIQDMLEEAADIIVDGKNKPEVCVVEVGGTVGDMESMHFVEALRQMSYESSKHTFCFVHVSLIINNHGEGKTKPTQNSVCDLRKMGISPNLLVLRSSCEITDGIREKISRQCQVKSENIFTNIDLQNIYQVPLHLGKQNITNSIEKVLSLKPPVSMEDNKISCINRINNVINYYSTGDLSLKVVIVGKYTDGIDTYLSIHRAVEHAAYFNEIGVTIKYIDSKDPKIAKEEIAFLADVVIIPGGFGYRGTEGMIEIAEFCRKSDIPTLGICLGMQIMCIESARNILGKNCVSSEIIPEGIDKSNYYTIVEEMSDLEWENMGGTMRLGSYDTVIQDDTKAFLAYGKNVIRERHRHRYEINPKYVDIIEQSGLIFSGKNKEIGCVDIVEDPSRKFYVGCQYHPEFQSCNDKPSPLFLSLIKSFKEK